MRIWNRLILFIAAIISCFLFAGCSKSGQGSMPPAIVVTAPVKTQLWQNSINATGALSPIQGTQFKSDVAGRVTKIYFQPGQKIHTGDALLDINPTALAAQYKAAQATADLQQANYRRAKILYQQKVISRADFDTTLYNRDSAAASANAAAASLALAQIKAPFDGTIGIQLVNVGNYVAAGTPLFNLEQLDQLRADFQIPERYTAQVKNGDKFILSLKNDATQDDQISGQITGIDTAINSETRMLALQGIVVNNPQHPLLPGNFAQVQLFYGKPYQVMTVPSIAVTEDGVSHKIYKVDKGIAHLVPVTLGQRFSDRIIIETGLQPGDVVVIDGLIKLHDGDAVANAAPKKLPATQHAGQ
jgi:membrane fusion protein (multidrug efflux system)